MRTHWPHVTLATLLGCGSSDGSAQQGETSADASDVTSNASSSEGMDGSTFEPTSTGSSDGSTAGCEPLPADVEVASEDVSLTTTDGKSIAGTFWRPAAGTCRPAVLLVHQFQRSRSQWETQVERLVSAGMVTLAIDLRGHGDSDAQDGDIGDLLTDPDQAPLDVAAGLEALRADDPVDATRIGVVGTSIGANLAIVAMTQHPDVRASVSISPRMSAIEALAAGPPQLELTNVLCLAGELDGGGAQAQTCTDLVELATGTAEATIYPGSSAHGTAILEMFDDSAPAVVEWLGSIL